MLAVRWDFEKLNFDDMNTGELKEPNHLDFKIQNKYGEWVWKSPYAMNRYVDEWEAWHNQERQKLKEKHGLSDEELNYRG